MTQVLPTINFQSAHSVDTPLLAKERLQERLKTYLLVSGWHEHNNILTNTSGLFGYPTAATPSTHQCTLKDAPEGQIAYAIDVLASSRTDVGVRLNLLGGWARQGTAKAISVRRISEGANPKMEFSVAVLGGLVPRGPIVAMSIARTVDCVSALRTMGPEQDLTSQEPVNGAAKSELERKDSWHCVLEFAPWDFNVKDMSDTWTKTAHESWHNIAV